MASKGKLNGWVKLLMAGAGFIAAAGALAFSVNVNRASISDLCEVDKEHDGRIRVGEKADGRNEAHLEHIMSDLADIKRALNVQ